MSNYQRLSHTVWDCRYHVVFCPKYRYPILEGNTEVLVRNEPYKLVSQKDQMKVIEVNLQIDHIHLILSIPPKYSVSSVMGYLKGKLATRLFRERPSLRKQYWGKHLWARGYCISTVGMDEALIRKYVKWAQDREQLG